MSNWPSIIFLRGLSVTFGEFARRFYILYSFFLAGRFYFCSQSVLPYASFTVMLFVIVFLLPSFWVNWFDFECILFVLFIVRRTRHAGHCWRSKDELISDVLLWTPTYGCARVGRPARTYIQQLCEDTGCNPEDLPEAMNDREKWRERVRDIRAGGATWWWWWFFLVCVSSLWAFLSLYTLV